MHKETPLAKKSPPVAGPCPLPGVHALIQKQAQKFENRKSSNTTTPIPLSIGGPRLPLLDRPSVEYVVSILKQHKVPHLRLLSGLRQDDGAQAIFADFLQHHNEHLKCLSLSNPCHLTAKGSAALLDCISLAYSHDDDDGAAIFLAELKLCHFNFCNPVVFAALNRLLCQAGSVLRSLEFQECQFGPNACEMVESLNRRGQVDREPGLEEFTMALCRVPDKAFAKLLQALETVHHLKRLALSRCFLGPQAFTSLNRLLMRLIRLEELVLTEDDDTSWGPGLKLEFTTLLRYWNDSLQRVHISTRATAAAATLHQDDGLLSSPRLWHQDLQHLAQRNRLHSKVRTSLHKAPLDLGLWGQGLATLATKDRATASSALYLALSSLSPQLKQESDRGYR